MPPVRAQSPTPPDSGCSVGPHEPDHPAEARLDRIRAIVERAVVHARQPIDLNYIAVPKDAWEDLCFELLAELGRRLDA